MITPAFTPDEVQTAEPTRSARLKWVIVVAGDAPVGRMANAVACIAASTGAAIAGLVAHGGPDAAASAHEGLPWAGCTVLTASSAQLLELRTKAAASDAIWVADMPVAAQTNRVYDGYLAELATLEQPELIAASFVGARNAVDRLVKRLDLL